MTYWDRPDAQAALAARHADRVVINEARTEADYREAAEWAAARDREDEAAIEPRCDRCDGFADEAIHLPAAECRTFRAGVTVPCMVPNAHHPFREAA